MPLAGAKIYDLDKHIKNIQITDIVKVLDVLFHNWPKNNQYI